MYVIVTLVLGFCNWLVHVSRVSNTIRNITKKSILKINEGKKRVTGIVMG